MSDFDRIEEVAKIENLTLNALAKKLGLKTSQRFYDIKAGKHGISRELAETIQAKYLNINLSWLLTGEGEKFIPDTKTAKIDSATGQIENADIHQLIVNNTTLTDAIKNLTETNTKLAEKILELTESKKTDAPKDENAGHVAASGFSE